MTHPIARLLMHSSRSARLMSSVSMDQALADACRPFDYEFSGVSEFTLPTFDAPTRDGSWSVGLIVGPSGSGKSSLLRQHYGTTPEVEWDPTKAIASQVSYEKLSAVGLSSVPVWCRPFHVLSNGEAFRANMAALLGSNTTFDEFSSVVDRVVAKAVSHAVQRYIRANTLTGIVLASCHYDIIEWLNPDWVFDTQTGCLSLMGCLRRRELSHIEVFPCHSSAWELFRDHHYLTGNMNKASRCYLAMWGDNPIGFASTLAYPSGTVKNAWREHRTVVLPDYQGMGIGVRLSDFVAALHVRLGHRYFSKTAHPRMGEYRERSPFWIGTSKNKKARHDYSESRKTKEDAYKMKHAARVCYSHEFIGGGDL